MKIPEAFRATRARLPGGLLAFALVLLLMLLAYQLWISYRDQVRTAEISTRNLAVLFETRLQGTLRRIDADLAALVEDLPPEALNQRAVARFGPAINADLDRRMFNLEEMAGYRIHDAAGDTLYASDNANVQRVNVADRSYFTYLRDHPDAGLVFSEVVTGRSTNRQVLVILRALRGADGRFAGIVHGLLELGYYKRQFQSLELGRHGFIALRRSDDQTLVVRWPEVPEEVNRPLPPDHPIVLALGEGRHEISMTYYSSIQRQTMIVGAACMPDYPFYFAVATGLDDVLVGWRQQALIVSVTSLLLLTLIGTLLLRMRRMRAREAGILGDLAQSESQFRELAQIVPVGIAHFDVDGRYTFVNDRHMAITGRRRDELIGRDWSAFVHPEDVERIGTLWPSSASAARAFVGECRFARPDGELAYVLAEVQGEIGKDGRLLGATAALTDITQRKRAEAELLVAKQQAESANLAKTRFLAAASHDLRQPIQAINLFRDALERTALSEEQHAISRFLSKSVQSLGELLYSLLDISKLDAGQVRPQLKPLPVEELFRALDAEFSTLARQKNLRFKLFFPFRDELLVTDPDLMTSVLRNLIDNALKYTERGGILIGYRRRGTQAVIQVWDTGIGIEPRYGDRIFEECFQIGNPVRDRSKGLGLGLSIVRRTARLLGCEVTYRSRFGRGSVFELLLPQQAVAGVFERSAALAAGLGEVPTVEEDYSAFKGWRVVVIEDDLAVATSIEVALRTLGVHVTVFGSAELALASVDGAGVDCYISDFSLPGMNGLQLLDALQRRAGGPIRGVLVTGETSPERIALTTSSRWKVLFKPVSLPGLAAAMREARTFSPG